MTHRQSIGPLQADRNVYSSRARRVCHDAGFVQIATQWPFAIDVLARSNRRHDNRVVFGHFHRHGDDIDIRIARERK